MLFRSPKLILAACLLLALPARAQAYKSAFTEPVFDAAHAPKSQFGDVQVDPATGHVSLRIPLGPGIGARGAVFRPTVAIDETYNHHLIETALDERTGHPIEVKCLPMDGDYERGGPCADLADTEDQVRGNSLAGLFPGTFDLAVPHGYLHEDVTSRFRAGEVSGVLYQHQAVPSAVQASAILAKFGYPSSVVLGNAPALVRPGDARSPLLTMASGNYLVLALAGGTYLEKSFSEPLFHDQETTTDFPQLCYPGGILVVAGDVAYEFTPAFPKLEQASHVVIGTNASIQVEEVWSHNHFHYRLSRILNAFGEEIRFTYSGPQITPAPGTSRGGTDKPFIAAYHIQAEWWRQGMDTGVGITMDFHPSTSTAQSTVIADGKTRYAVAYSGIGQSLSYTLASASRGASLVTHQARAMSMDDPTPSDTSTVPIFDNATTPASYNFEESLTGVSPVEGIWNAVPFDAVIQDQTHERLDFQLPVSSPKEGIAEVAYSVDGQAATRAVYLHWSPEYDFLDTESAGSEDGLVIRQGHSWTVGVDRVEDVVEGTNGPVTRTTTYSRTVPKPWYQDLVPETEPYTGLYHPSGIASATGGILMVPFSWQSKTFQATVTEPDGRRVEYTYATPPDSPTEGLNWVLFLKNRIIQEDRYGADGTHEQTTTFSYFDTHGVGNPDGTGVNPMPVATHWEVKDYLAGRWEIHDISSRPGISGVGWDATNLGWTGEQVIIKNLAGTQLADRTLTRTLTNHLQVFLPGQSTGDRPVDPTVRVPVARSGFDATANLWSTETYGNAGGPQVLLHQDWARSTGLLNDAWVSDPGSTTPTYGAKYGYDAFGFANSIAPIDAAHASLAVSQTSNGLGWPLSQTDPNGILQSFAWDASGRLKSQGLPNGELGKSYAYDPGSMTLTVTRGVQVEKHIYNGFGDPIRIVRSNGDGTYSHRAFGYDAAGHLAWETTWRAGDGAGVDWTSDLAPDDVYDPGQAAWTEVTDQCASWILHPDGTRSCRAYKTIQHPAIPPSTTYNNSTHYSYDAHNRVILVRNPNQTVTRTDYAETTTGSTRTITVAPGTAAERRQIDAYDPLGRLVKVTAMSDTGPLDSVYAYDNADRLLQVTQWSGPVGTGPSQIRTWGYDGLGRLNKLIQPESGTTTYSSFIPIGKPQVTVYGVGSSQPVTLTTTYDAMGRVKAVSSSNGTVSQSFVYGDEAAGAGHGLARGKLVSATNGTVSRVMTYSGLNGRLSALARILDGHQFNQSLAYDPSYGFLTSRTYPDGKVQTLTYDNARSMPHAVSFRGTNLATFGYDPSGWMLKQVTYANGATNGYDYRPDQVSLKSLVPSVPGVALKGWAFTYDEAEDLGTDGEDWYSYDKLGRLTAAFLRDPMDTTLGHGIHQLISYDAFGNRTSLNSQRVTNWTDPTQPPGSPTLTALASTDHRIQSYSMNASEITAMAATNRLPSTVGGVATGATYDPLGNLTRMFGVPGDSTSQLTLTYDALGRITSLGDTKHATSQAYAYDDEGLRIKITDSATGKVSYHIYDEARHLIAEVEVPSGGALTWKNDLLYVGDKEVAEVDGAHTWVEFLDHLGSPRYQWDGTAVTGIDGVHLIAQKYAPFGEYLNDPTTQAPFAKGFTNHEQTDPSGLIYMQARFYAPMYGRFLSPDPARDQHFEETQSWNIYSYVQNDPTMRIDMNGMQEAMAVAFRGLQDAKLTANMTDAQRMQFLKNERKAIVVGAAGGVALAAGVEAAPAAPSLFTRVLVALGLKAAQNPAAMQEMQQAGPEVQQAAQQGVQGAAQSPAAMEAAMKAADVKGVINSAGMTLRQAGEFFGWGKDPATNRTFVGAIQNFTKVGLEKAGWTLERLQALGRAYQQVAAANPNNPSAAMRAQQMQDLAKLFRK